MGAFIAPIFYVPELLCLVPDQVWDSCELCESEYFPRGFPGLEPGSRVVKTRNMVGSRFKP